METQICKTCNKSKELTEELWYRNKSNWNGWNVNCKVCVRAYQNKRRHRTLEEIQYLNKSEPENFGGFETQALRDRFRDVTKPAISIDQEI